MRPWIVFFSQTGTEINNLCKRLEIYPDAIITNKQTTEGINMELFNTTTFREYKLNRTIWYMLQQKPDLESYKNILSHFNNPVITLHGYLRVIPKEICEKYEIYNLHPGLIDKFPSLKGFNPQERAFREGYKHAGCVVHRVTSGVDEGEILLSQGISIEGKSLDEVYSSLSNVALDLWKSFFTEFKVLKK
jgi:folate-dependent phosphoribosylglycinamide formyltransferase PurN